MADRVEDFVEALGLMWERFGSNRTQGRVLGYLMVCDPPEQTAADLVKALQVSQASVSTATRGLELTGLVRRVSLPGERRVWYRMDADAWRTYPQFAKRQFGVMKAMAEQALRAMEGEPEEAKARVRSLWATSDWWQRRYEGLLEEWEAQPWPQSSPNN